MSPSLNGEIRRSATREGGWAHHRSVRLTAMHGYDLILTLTAGLGVALFFGYFTQRFGLSPIVGYLLAGVLVGPNTPGIEIDPGIAEQLSEIGVILLMFGVGLQFHVEELLAVRGVARAGRHRAVRGVDRGRRGPGHHDGLGRGWQHRLRHRARGGEHGRGGARAVGLQRAAHAGRAHFRRLARRRGRVYGDRHRAAAARWSAPAKRVNRYGPRSG